LVPLCTLRRGGNRGRHGRCHSEPEGRRIWKRDTSLGSVW